MWFLFSLTCLVNSDLLPRCFPLVFHLPTLPAMYLFCVPLSSFKSFFMLFPSVPLGFCVSSVVSELLYFRYIYYSKVTFWVTICHLDPLPACQTVIKRPGIVMSSRPLLVVMISCVVDISRLIITLWKKPKPQSLSWYLLTTNKLQVEGGGCFPGLAWPLNDRWWGITHWGQWDYPC